MTLDKVDEVWDDVCEFAENAADTVGEALDSFADSVGDFFSIWFDKYVFRKNAQIHNPPLTGHSNLSALLIYANKCSVFQTSLCNPPNLQLSKNRIDSRHKLCYDTYNGSTLKRLVYDKRKKRPVLHPENSSMKDICPDEIVVQGVAVKVIKDLP